jgi:hypothetical protein
MTKSVLFIDDDPVAFEHVAKEISSKPGLRAAVFDPADRSGKLAQAINDDACVAVFVHRKKGKGRGSVLFEVNIPRQSRGLYDMSRSKRLFGDR